MLKKLFGFDRLRAFQAPVIKATLENKQDVFVQMSTGSGKVSP